MSLGLLLSTQAAVTNAEYQETIAPCGLTKNVCSDYGIVDDKAETNQSATVQEAIDDIAAAGDSSFRKGLSNVRETSVQFYCSCRRQTAKIPRSGERSYDSNCPFVAYRFAGVYLKSNVHLLIEKDAVIKPYWPEAKMLDALDR